MENEKSELGEQKLRAKVKELVTARERHDSELKKAYDETKKQEERIEKLEEEIGKKSEKIERLENEKKELITKNIKRRKATEKYFDEKYFELEAELKEAREEIERYKKMIETYQIEGKISNESCVLDSLCWTWKEKLPEVPAKCSCGRDYCRRKLEKILIHDDEKKIKKKNLNCDRLMYVLKERKIVKLEKIFDYSEDRDDKIKEAWRMIIDKKKNKQRVLMMLKKSRLKDGEVFGHVVVCDLDAMPGDERTVEIYDPQEVRGGSTDEEKFSERPKDETALYLFTVNLDELKEIIEKYNPNPKDKTGESSQHSSDITQL